MDLTEFFGEYKSYSLIVHIVSATLGVAVALWADILFSFYGRDKKLSAKEVRRLDRVSKIIWTLLAVIILSGLAIFLSDPLTYAASAKFLAKMSVVAVIAINGYVLARLVQPSLKYPDLLTSARSRSVRQIAFTCGAISLTSWLSAFSLALAKDITLTYVELMSLYGLVVLGAIMVALLVEWWTFR